MINQEIDFDDVYTMTLGGQSVKTLSINDVVVWTNNAYKGIRFIAEQDYTKIIFIRTSTQLSGISLSYSLDNGNTWKYYTLGYEIMLSKVGKSVCFRATSDNSIGFYSNNHEKGYCFSITTGKARVEGDIRSLGNVNWETYYDNHAFPNFGYLFYGFKIKSAPILHQSLTNFLYAMAFRGSSLTSIDLSNLTKIGEKTLYYTFYKCNSLTSVDLSNLTQTSSYSMFYAFNGCNSLTSVNLSSLESVGQGGMSNAFTDCTSLTSVSIPKLKSISAYGLDNCFSGCTSLKSVDLSSLKGIPRSGLAMTFKTCYKLESVDLSSVSGAGYYSLDQTFYGCSKLKVVKFNNATAVPSLSNVNAFQNTNSTYKVVVPDALYDEWITATNWSSIASHIVKVSEYVEE